MSCRERRDARALRSQSTDAHVRLRLAGFSSTGTRPARAPSVGVGDTARGRGLPAHRAWALAARGSLARRMLARAARLLRAPWALARELRCRALREIAACQRAVFGRWRRCGSHVRRMWAWGARPARAPSVGAGGLGAGSWPTSAPYVGAGGPWEPRSPHAGAGCSIFGRTAPHLGHWHANSAAAALGASRADLTARGERVCNTAAVHEHRGCVSTPRAMRAVCSGLGHVCSDLGREPCHCLAACSTSARPMWARSARCALAACLRTVCGRRRRPLQRAREHHRRTAGPLASCGRGQHSFDARPCCSP